MSEQLYDNLQTIQRYHFHDPFPIGPGSHVDNLTNPALEFVKSVTEVLMLDHDVCGEAVSLLKRNLLKMCKIPEFDLTAVWEGKALPLLSLLSLLPLLLPRVTLQCTNVPMYSSSSTSLPPQDPCRSYTMQDVICANCNYCRDLDLCRDPLLITNNSDEWPCPQCGSTYDKNAIELTLVQKVSAG